MERGSNAKLGFLLILFLAASLIACSSGEEHEDMKKMAIRAAILGRKVNALCYCGPSIGSCGDHCGRASDMCFIFPTMPVGICLGLLNK